MSSVLNYFTEKNLIHEESTPETTSPVFEDLKEEFVDIKPEIVPFRKNLSSFWVIRRLWEEYKESYYDEVIYRAERLGTTPTGIVELGVRYTNCYCNSAILIVLSCTMLAIVKKLK
jgi:hypothetical protein